MVSQVLVVSLACQEPLVLLVALASQVQLDSLVYQEAQETQVSQATVDRMAYKVLRELLVNLVHLVVLGHKDFPETLALPVRRHLCIFSYLYQFVVFCTVESMEC